MNFDKYDTNHGKRHYPVQVKRAKQLRMNAQKSHAKMKLTAIFRGISRIWNKLCPREDEGEISQH